LKPITELLSARRIRQGADGVSIGKTRTILLTKTACVRRKGLLIAGSVKQTIIVHGNVRNGPKKKKKRSNTRKQAIET
jgi:hypothetical protein